MRADMCRSFASAYAFLHHDLKLIYEKLQTDIYLILILFMVYLILLNPPWIEGGRYGYDDDPAVDVEPR